MPGPWFPALIATAIGLVFLARGAAWLRQQRAWRPAQGVVRDYQTVNPTAEPGEWLLAPVVEFVTADGTTVSARDSVGTNPPRYRRGQHVPVRYDPRDPSTIVVGAGPWPGVAFLAVGAVLLGVAVAILALA
jgi:hypothetical protein